MTAVGESRRESHLCDPLHPVIRVLRLRQPRPQIVPPRRQGIPVALRSKENPGITVGLSIYRRASAWSSIQSVYTVYGFFLRSLAIRDFCGHRDRILHRAICADKRLHSL